MNYEKILKIITWKNLENLAYVTKFLKETNRNF